MTSAVLPPPTGRADPRRSAGHFRPSAAVVFFGLWATVGVALELTRPLLVEAFWILGLLPWPAWWIGGVALVAGVAFADERDWRFVVGVPLVIAAMWFGGPRLNHLGEHVVLLWRLPTYERIVAQAQAGRTKFVGDEGRARVDAGPPVRVFFRTAWGGSDNWRGYVYDPTGAVGAARGWGRRAGDYTAPPAVRELFHGDLVSCRRLQGPWWSCTLT